MIRYNLKSLTEKLFYMDHVVRSFSGGYASPVQSLYGGGELAKVDGTGHELLVKSAFLSVRFRN